MESTETVPSRCEIARLPDDLLSATLARTAPRDACRAAAVSPTFRVAADADAVWSNFLPRDLPPLADGELELPADPLSKKQLFMRLSDPANPVLLADGLTEAGHCLGRYAAVLALDPHHPLQITCNKQNRCVEESMDPMTTSTAITTIIACEIVRLPVDLISASIARTGPRDACRAAVVSTAFCTAADSDIVWNCFLPSNLPLLALGELYPPPPSKKALFMWPSDSPILLDDGLTSIWLDKQTDAMCYMMSARKLSIDWSDIPTNLRWIPVTRSRIFSDAATFCRGHRLEIHGKIDSSMLSKHTTYTAYIVLAVDEYDRCRWFGPCQKTPVTVSLGGSMSTRDVFLDSRDLAHRRSWQMRRGGISRACGAVLGPVPDHIKFCSQKADVWMEVELGEFYNDEGEDGEVSISLVDTSLRRIGLFVLGIEIIAN